MSREFNWERKYMELLYLRKSRCVSIYSTIKTKHKPVARFDRRKSGWKILIASE